VGRRRGNRSGTLEQIPKPHSRTRRWVPPRNGASANAPAWSGGCSPGADHLPRRDLERSLRLGSRSSGVGGQAGGVARVPAADLPPFSRIACGEVAGRSNGAISKISSARLPHLLWSKLGLLVCGICPRNQPWVRVWVQDWVQAPLSRASKCGRLCAFDNEIGHEQPLCVLSEAWPGASYEGVHPQLMLYTAYFDEADTHGPSPTIIMAGFLGTAREWQLFDRRLRALQRRDGFTTFHVKEFKRKSGEFALWSDTKCMKLVNDLTELVRDELTEGLTVHLEHERYLSEYRAPPVPKGMRLDSQYGICFRACMRQVLEIVMADGKPHRLDVVIEHGHRNARDTIEIFNDVKRRLKERRGLDPSGRDCHRQEARTGAAHGRRFSGIHLFHDAGISGAGADRLC
jgi:hypothetical protein